MHYRTEMQNERRRTIKTLLRRRKINVGNELGPGENRHKDNVTGENMSMKFWTS